MMEQITRVSSDEDVARFFSSEEPAPRFERLTSFPAPIDCLVRSAHFDPVRSRHGSFAQAVFHAVGRSGGQRNEMAASVARIMRDLAQIWRLMLASRIDEAVIEIEEIELRLEELPAANARRFRGATQLLRAAAFAFQDDSLAVLPIAISLLKRGGTTHENHAALTLCRLGFWRLGEFDCFGSLPRLEPRARWSKSLAISAMLDLAIEAAVAFEQLRVPTAKRLAFDALNISKSTAQEAAGLATVSACVAAQVLYEEGCLDQADALLRYRLPVIKASGPIESALRAYLVLTRIARQRQQYYFAALLLHEAEALGERRGWPRLVAACLAERVLLLLRRGRTREARLVLEYLERHAESHRSGSGHATYEMTRYRTVTRWRVIWAETSSHEAVAGMRRLYHEALEKRDLYVGYGLAIELAEMLAAVEETEAADALYFHTVKASAAAGIYQIFLEGGPLSGTLLRRAYARAAMPDSAERDVLAFAESLLSRWGARDADRAPERPGGRVSDMLTARERDVLAMISQGFANKRIARALAISPETVKSHVKHIFAKLAVSTRTEAVSRAGSLGLM